MADREPRQLEMGSRKAVEDGLGASGRTGIFAAQALTVSLRYRERLFV